MKKKSICIINSILNQVLSMNFLKTSFNNIIANIKLREKNNLKLFDESREKQIKDYCLEIDALVQNQIKIKEKFEKDLINYNKKILLSLGYLYFNSKKFNNDCCIAAIMKKSFDYENIFFYKMHQDIFINLISGKYKNFLEFESKFNF